MKRGPQYNFENHDSTFCPKVNYATDLGELKFRNHMQGRIQIVSGHRFLFCGMDVGSWASCISLAAAKPGAAPLNKGFQLTAHLSGRVMNGLRFWETRLFPQFEKSLYSRNITRGGRTPTHLLSHRHICSEGGPPKAVTFENREWLVITDSAITQRVYLFVRLLMKHDFSL